MKKAAYLSVYSTVFLLISAIVTVVSCYFTFSDAWIPLILAFAVLILSVVLTIVLQIPVGRKLYIISTLNSAALGFAMRAWYIYRNLNNSFFTFLLVILAAVAVLLLFYVISFIPFVDRHYPVFSWILTALILLLYIAGLFLLRNTWLSTLGYYLIFIWAAVFCMCSDAHGDNFRERVLLSSFSVWIIAVIILLFMLDADGFDMVDFDGFSMDSPRHQTVWRNQD